MISSSPIERIANLLVDAKYTRLSVPLKVLKLSFDVGAAFIGSETSSDLIVVIDGADKQETRTIQIVEALSRALDVARSRRSLTVILVGRRPVSVTLDRLGRVSRVLPVGESSEQEILQDWLAVLLPLEIPEIDEMPGPVLQDADKEASEPYPFSSGFEQAALQGEEVVQKLLIALIERPFAGDDEPDVMEESQ